MQQLVDWVGRRGLPWEQRMKGVSAQSRRRLGKQVGDSPFSLLAAHEEMVSSRTQHTGKRERYFGGSSTKLHAPFSWRHTEIRFLSAIAQSFPLNLHTTSLRISSRNAPPAGQYGECIIRNSLAGHGFPEYLPRKATATRSSITFQSAGVIHCGSTKHRVRDTPQPRQILSLRW